MFLINYEKGLNLIYESPVIVVWRKCNPVHRISIISSDVVSLTNWKKFNVFWVWPSSLEWFKESCHDRGKYFRQQKHLFNNLVNIKYIKQTNNQQVAYYRYIFHFAKRDKRGNRLPLLRYCTVYLNDDQYVVCHYHLLIRDWLSCDDGKTITGQISIGHKWCYQTRAALV